MSRQPDTTEITLVATEYDAMQVFVIRADGPDADRFATRLFDDMWKGESGNSVAYNGTTFAGGPELLSGTDHELDLRGMRTMDEVDAAIQGFHAPGRSPR